MAAGAAAQNGANLVEWRVDPLCEDEAGFRACRTLIEQSPLPCILTCRIQEEGGQAFGIEPDRPGLFRSLVSAGVVPRYVDVESAAWRSDRELRIAAGELLGAGECGLILSSHDFEGPPADLARQLDVMWAEDDVSIVKMAWRARSIRDSLEAFDLVEDAGGPMIAICMDRFGVMTRVLTGKFGGLLTFASPGSDQETAPGQLSLQQLRDTYRFDAITSSTRVFGVLGDPVEHSRSPLLHNTGFSHVGFDGVMVPMPVVDGWESFKASLACMLDHETLNLSGLAVTTPHKEHLARFVEEVGGTLTPMVHRCGAANTLAMLPDGSLVADNTDTEGVLAPLRGVMPIKDSKIALLGAGGAARGAAIGLLMEGAEVVVFNRSEDRAMELVKDVKSRMDDAVSIEYQSGGPQADEGFDAVINMTTLGMEGGPGPDRSPLDELGGSLDVLSDTVVVFDAVYAPLQTPLIKQACDRGAKVLTGDAMFLAQAARQFRTWTGQDAPMDAWASLMR